MTDIHAEAHRQIAAGGVSAVSMSGIAQSLGMSAAALYRYFRSRDDLVRAVIAESFEANAQVVEHTMSQTTEMPASARLRRLLDDNRRWALQHPAQYAIITGSLRTDQEINPDELVAPSRRPFYAICSLLAQIGTPATGRRHTAEQALAQHLKIPTDPQGPGALPREAVLRGLVVWSRLHGVISLELTGVFDRTGVDADQFFRYEVDSLLTPDT